MIKRYHSLITLKSALEWHTDFRDKRQDRAPATSWLLIIYKIPQKWEEIRLTGEKWLKHKRWTWNTHDRMLYYTAGGWYVSISSFRIPTKEFSATHVTRRSPWDSRPGNIKLVDDFEVLKHFIRHSHVSVDNRMILTYDTNESHISRLVVRLAWENGVHNYVTAPLQWPIATTGCWCV